MDLVLEGYECALFQDVLLESGWRVDRFIIRHVWVHWFMSHELILIGAGAVSGLLSDFDMHQLIGKAAKS